MVLASKKFIFISCSIFENYDSDNQVYFTNSEYLLIINLVYKFFYFIELLRFYYSY